MTKREKLYQLASDEGVKIYNFHISATKKAMFSLDGNIAEIMLDKQNINTDFEETMLLAEEMGHYETGSAYFLRDTYNSKMQRINRLKDEYKAKSWEIEYLLPFDEIQGAIKKTGPDLYQISDFLNLPIYFLQKAIDFYLSKGLQLGKFDT